MRGAISHEYFRNPSINKPIEQIYADMDGFTYEIFENEPHEFKNIYAWLVLPPLHYGGKFIKGILVSPSMELLIQKFPQVRELFHTIVSPRWAGIPCSTSADAVMCGYNNPHRENWFRQQYPHRSHQVLIPLEHGIDGLNEYFFAPPWAYIDRDIDVLCVGRLSTQKNLPLMVQAASVYQKKYHPSSFNMTLVIGKQFGDNLENLTVAEKRQHRLVFQSIENSAADIKVIPQVPRGKKMSELYAHSKIFALGSLIEGKCRAQREAILCNTPVACFEAYNQYARGDEAVFPEGCGMTVNNFDAESVAHTWHTMIQNYGEFSPRQKILQVYGRNNYFNQVLSAFSYYQEEVPDYNTANPCRTIWFDLATHANYQISFYDFLYMKKGVLKAAGLIEIKKMLEIYSELFLPLNTWEKPKSNLEAIAQ